MTTKPRLAAVAAAAATTVALTAWTGSASAHTPSPTPTADGPSTSAVQLPPDPRTEAAMPKRDEDVDFRYAAALMQLPTEQLETTYMGEIIPHHQAVLDMAKVALEKSQRPEVTSLANAIIASQTNQIQGFTKMLKEQYGLTPEQARQQAPEKVRGLIEQVNEATAQSVATVEQAPADENFDRVWLSTVVPHHQTAILESLAVQDGARTPTLVLMANSTISSQADQIEQMLNWLVQWYGG